VNYGFCDALDISPGALESARAAAERAGIANVSYVQHDINCLKLSHPYDLVFASGIHHISNLEHVFRELARWMRLGAPFKMYEYLGPNRCQPTARQLEAINTCIRWLPERYGLRVSVQRRLGASGPDEVLQVLHRKREEMSPSKSGEPLSTDPESQVSFGSSTYQ
jgi:ubiquinone/menaquinone biosynthesis C-methylase UbiE